MIPQSYKKGPRSIVEGVLVSATEHFPPKVHDFDQKTVKWPCEEHFQKILYLIELLDC